MSFVYPPTAKDIGDTDYGPYPVAEIIAARSSVLETVKQEHSAVWSRLRNKLGIMPDGKRLKISDPAHVWIPNPLPEYWSAQVALQHSTQEEVTAWAEGTGRGVGGEKTSWGAPSTLNSQHGNAAPSSASSSTLESVSVPVGFNADTSSRQPCSSSSDAAPGLSRRERRILKAIKGKKTDPHNSITIDDSDSDDVVVTDFDVVVTDFTPGVEGGEKKKPEEGGRSWGICRVGTPTEVEEPRKDGLTVIFRCDLCSFFCPEAGAMWEHLELAVHFSASKFLGRTEPSTGQLLVRYTLDACVLRVEENAFRTKIPCCPVCPAAFLDVERCASHCLGAHAMQGAYTLRDVKNSFIKNYSTEKEKCQECHVIFKKRGLAQHVHDTGHMALYSGRWKREDAMMVFPCRFCRLVTNSFFVLKKHVLDSHHPLLENKTMTIASFALGKSSLQPLFLPPSLPEGQPRPPTTDPPASRPPLRTGIKRKMGTISKLNQRLQSFMSDRKQAVSGEWETKEGEKICVEEMVELVHNRKQDLIYESAERKKKRKKILRKKKEQRRRAKEKKQTSE